MTSKKKIVIPIKCSTIRRCNNVLSFIEDKVMTPIVTLTATFLKLLLIPTFFAVGFPMVWAATYTYNKLPAVATTPELVHGLAALYEIGMIIGVVHILIVSFYFLENYEVTCIKENST